MRLCRALAFFLGLAAVAGFLLVASGGRNIAVGFTAEDPLPMLERASYLRRACQHLSTREKIPSPLHPGTWGILGSLKKDLSSGVNRGNFIHDERRKLLFCWNHKAASTAWFRLFTDINNITMFFNKEDSLYRLPQFMSPRTESDMKSAQEGSFKILVVRHPFTRLVSAFRDRFLRSNATFQFRGYASSIMSQPAHHNSTQPESSSSSPSFGQFARFVVASASAGQEPDSHWRPFHQQCAPCAVRFDAVLKLESMRGDFKDLQRVLPEMQNATLRRLRSAQHESLGEMELAKSFLGQLTAEERERLAEVYSMDFKLFNYDADDIVF